MKEAQYQKMTAFCRKTKTREKITAGITKYLPDLLAAAYPPRPYDQMNYYPLISHKPGNSFPSRHTASSVIIAMAFWYVCQPLGITAAALAVLVGISRVVAGLHYPRDVLAGAAVSLVVGGLGFWVV